MTIFWRENSNVSKKNFFVNFQNTVFFTGFTCSFFKCGTNDLKQFCSLTCYIRRFQISNVHVHAKVIFHFSLRSPWMHKRAFCLLNFCDACEVVIPKWWCLVLVDNCSVIKQMCPLCVHNFTGKTNFYSYNHDSWP